MADNLVVVRSCRSSDDDKENASQQSCALAKKSRETSRAPRKSLRSRISLLSPNLQLPIEDMLITLKMSKMNESSRKHWSDRVKKMRAVQDVSDLDSALGMFALAMDFWCERTCDLASKTPVVAAAEKEGVESALDAIASTEAWKRLDLAHLAVDSLEHRVTGLNPRYAHRMHVTAADLPMLYYLADDPVVCRVLDQRRSTIWRALELALSALESFGAEARRNADTVVGFELPVTSVVHVLTKILEAGDTKAAELDTSLLSRLFRCAFCVRWPRLSTSPGPFLQHTVELLELLIQRQRYASEVIPLCEEQTLWKALREAATSLKVASDQPPALREIMDSLGRILGRLKAPAQTAGNSHAIVVFDENMPPRRSNKPSTITAKLTVPHAASVQRRRLQVLG